MSNFKTHQKDRYKSLFINALFIALIAVFIFCRLFLYKGIQLSIGTNDTSSYIVTAQSKFLSMDFFTNSRPMTIPLLYKIFMPKDGYVLTAVGEPALKVNVDRAFQEGFNDVVISQMLIGMISWIFLAWELFRRFHKPLIKIISVTIVLLFALSPQIAEWDSILQSESLHISLFVLAISLSMELWSQAQIEIKRPIFTMIAVLWIISMILWEYTRDANLYSIIITVIFLFIGLLWLLIKKNKLPMELLFALVILSASVIFHNMTLNKSIRWEQPLMSNLANNVLPYETRTEFFVERGMPNVEELKINLSRGIRGYWYKDDAIFMSWLKQSGPKTYQAFLIHTPLWATLSFAEDLEELFSWDVQPYYITQNDKPRDYLLLIGKMLHSKSTLIVLSSLVMLVVSIISFFIYRNNLPGELLLTACWVFISSSILLFISYHGDFYSQGRHAVSATALLRLDYWLMLFILLDSAGVSSASRFESSE